MNQNGFKFNIGDEVKVVSLDSTRYRGYGVIDVMRIGETFKITRRLNGDLGISYRMPNGCNYHEDDLQSIKETYEETEWI